MPPGRGHPGMVMGMGIYLLGNNYLFPGHLFITSEVGVFMGLAQYVLGALWQRCGKPNGEVFVHSTAPHAR